MTPELFIPIVCSRVRAAFALRFARLAEKRAPDDQAIWDRNIAGLMHAINEVQNDPTHQLRAPLLEVYPNVNLATEALTVSIEFAIITILKEEGHI